MGRKTYLGGGTIIKLTPRQQWSNLATGAAQKIRKRDRLQKQFDRQQGSLRAKALAIASLNDPLKQRQEAAKRQQLVKLQKKGQPRKPRKNTKRTFTVVFIKKQNKNNP